MKFFSQQKSIPNEIYAIIHHNSFVPNLLDFQVRGHAYDAYDKMSENH